MKSAHGSDRYCGLLSEMTSRLRMLRNENADQKNQSKAKNCAIVFLALCGPLHWYIMHPECIIQQIDVLCAYPTPFPSGGVLPYIRYIASAAV